MDESLSLKFNTLENMKTVGNYEAELKRLTEENFELKHQVAYLKANQNAGQVDENIQKLLYDSKQSIDILENDNKNLSRQVENMKEVIRSSSEDRENLKVKLQDYESRLAICEEENDRLLNHLNSVRQKSDSLIEDYKGYDKRIQEYEKTISEMKMYIENIERDKDLYYSEGKKLLDDCTNLQSKINMFSSEKDRLVKENEDLKFKLNKQLEDLSRENSAHSSLNEKLSKLTKEKEELDEEIRREKKEWSTREQKLRNILSDYESVIKQKNLEIEGIKSYYTSKGDGQEYKEKYEKEYSENKSLKRENESLLNEMKSIRESYSNLKRRLEIVEDDKRALKYKIADYENSKEFERDSLQSKKELDSIRSQYNSLKRTHSDLLNLFDKSLADLSDHTNKQIDDITSELEKICDKANSINPSDVINMLGEEPQRFLLNLNIPRRDLNTIVSGFMKVYDKMRNKIEVLNNEVRDISKFNETPINSRVTEIVQKLAVEFKSAKADLENTKKYLEKKSKEIKEIKREKAEIEKKLSFIKSRYEDLKCKDLKIKESYNGILDTLRKKDELINKLEMRMIH